MIFVENIFDMEVGETMEAFNTELTVTNKSRGLTKLRVHGVSKKQTDVGFEYSKNLYIKQGKSFDMISNPINKTEYEQYIETI